jgi:hypothetical protein
MIYHKVEASTMILWNLRAVMCISLIFILSACQLSSSLQSKISTQPMPADGLIQYQRVGGIAGLDDRLNISKDGTLKLSRRGKNSEKQIEIKRLQDLQKLISDIQWENLQPSYSPEKKGVDYLVYTINYSDYRVEMVDTAIPKELQPLLSILNEIIKDSQ